MNKNWTEYEKYLHMNAMRMRDNPTPPEKALFDRLTKAKVDFLFQVVIGRYIADFVIPAKMIIIELDGTFHRKAFKKPYDKKRDEFLRICGFHVRRQANARMERIGMAYLKEGPMVKRSVFRAAKRKAHELCAEYYESRNAEIELSAIDREHKKMVETDRKRSIIVIKTVYEYTPGWDNE